MSTQVHSSPLARDLVVLYALEELSTIPLPNHPTDARARELLVMLHYVYWATVRSLTLVFLSIFTEYLQVMPPSARRTLTAHLRQIHDNLNACAHEQRPLSLSWLHIELAALGPSLERLAWRLGEGQEALSFETMVTTLKCAVVTYSYCWIYALMPHLKALSARTATWSRRPLN